MSASNDDFDDPFASSTDSFGELFGIVERENVTAASRLSASSVTPMTAARTGSNAEGGSGGASNGAKRLTSALQMTLPASAASSLQLSLNNSMSTNEGDILADVAAAEAREARFLRFERRGLLGQMSYNVGYSYFGGLLLGGLVGGVVGLRASPTSHPRVMLNSLLNGSGRAGARSGNAAGVLAMLYTVLERRTEDAEVDRLPGTLNNLAGADIFGRASRWPALVPATAAFATGALFVLPRALSMRGLDRHYVTLPKRAAVLAAGGVLAVAGTAVLSVVGPVLFGRRSPFSLFG